MPDRLLRKESVTSEKLNAVSIAAALQWHHMLTRADDFGLIDLAPASLKMNCWPGRSFTHAEIEAMNAELCAAGLLRAYDAAGKHLGALTGWHQVRWAKYAKYPRPPWGWEHIVGGYVAPRARGEGAEPPPPKMNGSILPRGWWQSDDGIRAAFVTMKLPLVTGEKLVDTKRRIFDELDRRRTTDGSAAKS